MMPTRMRSKVNEIEQKPIQALQKSSQSEVSKTKCKNCGNLIIKGRLQMHKKSCRGHGLVFQCTDGCDERFSTAKKRDLHHAAVHNLSMTCLYEGCGKVLKKRCYQAHVAAIHEIKMINCEYCNEEINGLYKSIHHKVCFIKQSIKPSKKKRKKEISNYILTERKLKCSLEGCETMFKTPSDRRRHEREVHESKREPCPYDDCKVTLKRSNLKNHLKYCHAEPGTIIRGVRSSIIKHCSICGRPFSPGQFHKHWVRCRAKLTGKRDFQCSFEGCSRSFISEADRYRHIRYVHEEKATVCCPEAGCGQMCKPSDLKKHIEWKHRNPFSTCNKCGIEVNTRSLSRHKSKCKGLISSRLIKCPVEGCNAILDPSRLKMHASILHDWKMQDCPRCLKSFLTDKLEAHLKHCTEKQVTCHYCEKIYRKNCLTAHFRYCPGARKDLGLGTNELAQCDYCKRMMKKSNLLMHFKHCPQAEDWVRKLFDNRDRKRVFRPQCDYCKMRMPKASLLRHFVQCPKSEDWAKQLWKKFLVSCPRCHFRMQEKTLPTHLTRCEGRKTKGVPLKGAQCHYCKAEMVKRSLLKHFQTCDEVTENWVRELRKPKVRCNVCQRRVRQKKLSSHRKLCLEKNWPLRLKEKVRCYHCNKKMIKRNLVRHFTKCEEYLKIFAPKPAKPLIKPKSTPSNRKSQVKKRAPKKARRPTRVQNSRSISKGCIDEIDMTWTRSRTCVTRFDPAKNPRRLTSPDTQASKVSCEHCGKKVSNRGLKIHLKYCKANLSADCTIVEEIHFAGVQVDVKQEFLDSEAMIDPLDLIYDEVVVEELKLEPIS